MLKYLEREIYGDIEPIILSRYWQYLDANYGRIPEGIHALATRRDYYNRKSERSPLDQIYRSISDADDGIIINVAGRGGKYGLQYRYIDVVEEFTPELSALSEPRWLVDEFRYESDGGFLHEIVWYVGGRKQVNWLFKAFGFELKVITGAQADT